MAYPVYPTRIQFIPFNHQSGLLHPNLSIAIAEVADAVVVITKIYEADEGICLKSLIYIYTTGWILYTIYCIAHLSILTCNYYSGMSEIHIHIFFTKSLLKTLCQGVKK